VQASSYAPGTGRVSQTENVPRTRRRRAFHDLVNDRARKDCWPSNLWRSSYTACSGRIKTPREVREIVGRAVALMQDVLSLSD
jgi:hypothetical protein